MRRMLMISVIGLMLSPALAGTAAASEGPDPSEAVRYVYQELQSIPWDDPQTNLTEELVETIEGIPEEIFALVCIMGMPVQYDSLQNFQSDIRAMTNLAIDRTAHVFADAGKTDNPSTEIWSIGLVVTRDGCNLAGSPWGEAPAWTYTDGASPPIKRMTDWWSNRPAPRVM